MKSGSRWRQTLALVIATFQVVMPIVAAIIVTMIVGWGIFALLFRG